MKALRPLQGGSAPSIHGKMMSIPQLAGFSPERWQKIIDIMLE
jgi:hypothetical protein